MSRSKRKSAVFEWVMETGLLGGNAMAHRGGFRGKADYLQEAADTQLKRMLSTNRLVLTHDEYLQLLVPAELREDFKRVAQYAVNGTNSLVIEWEHTYKMRLRLALGVYGGSKPPFVPFRPVLQQMQGDPVFDKVTSWVTWRYNVGLGFARVKKLVGELDDRCTAAAVRFYWPAAVTLCREHKVLEEFGEELAGLKLEGPPPPLPVGVRQACPLAAATVTGAAMIEAQEDPIDVPAEITFEPDYWGRDYGIKIEIGNVKLI